MTCPPIPAPAEPRRRPTAPAWVAAAALLSALLGSAPAAAQPTPPPDPFGPASDAAADSAADSGADAGSDSDPDSDSGSDSDSGPDSDSGSDSGSGSASDPSSPSPDRSVRSRVAVLLLAAADEVDPTVAEALSETLIGAVAARGGVTLIGQAEIGAQMGHDDAQLLECVGSPPCLGRLGVQLGLREFVAGTLGRRGERWVFNLNRVDVASGETVGRVFRELEGDLGDLADALGAAVPELYAAPAPEPAPEPRLPPPPRSGTLLLSAQPGAEVSVDGAVVGTAGDRPLRVEGLGPGLHEVRVRRGAARHWVRTVRLTEGEELSLEATLPVAYRESTHPVVWIAGAAAIASAGVGIALGVLSQDQLALTRDQRIEGSVTRAEVVDFYDARQREAIAADLLFAAAGALAVTALVMLFFPERTPIEVGPSGAGARF